MYVFLYLNSTLKKNWTKYRSCVFNWCHETFWSKKITSTKSKKARTVEHDLSGMGLCQWETEFSCSQKYQSCLMDSHTSEPEYQTSHWVTDMLCVQCPHSFQLHLCHQSIDKNHLCKAADLFRSDLDLLLCTGFDDQNACWTQKQRNGWKLEQKDDLDFDLKRFGEIQFNPLNFFPCKLPVPKFTNSWNIFGSQTKSERVAALTPNEPVAAHSSSSRLGKAVCFLACLPNQPKLYTAC